MGKSDWRVEHSAYVIAHGGDYDTIRVECYWRNVGWRYNMSPVYGYVYCNGEERNIFNGGWLNTQNLSNTDRLLLGYSDFVVPKTYSDKNVPCEARINSTSTYESGNKWSGSANVYTGARYNWPITYNANGGVNPPGNQTKWYNETLVLSTTIPTREWYNFAHWNSAANNSGYSAEPGYHYTSNQGTNYYAIWSPYQHTVVYNANGGSTVPSNQTKTVNVQMSITSTLPIRTGYTFIKWNTKTDGTGDTYNPGDNYTHDQNGGTINLYAIWQKNEYTISYNANTGTGAPSSQTKNHNETIQLSSVIPIKDKYRFLGWATSSTGAVVYQAGSNYSGNIDVTLYAKWEYAYVKPQINNLNIVRCTSTGVTSDNGTYLKVNFNWVTFEDVTEIKILWSNTSHTIAASGKSGAVTNLIIGANSISTESTYVIITRVKDSEITEISTNIPSLFFPIDIKNQGRGVAFGKSAELWDYLDSNFNSIFRKDLTVNGRFKNQNDLLIVSDTRSTNPTPQEILPNLNGIRFDFKYSTSVGLPSSIGLYVGVMTFKKWSSTSGGKVFQLATTDTNYIYTRTSGSDYTSWTEWDRLIKYSDIFDDYSNIITNKLGLRNGSVYDYIKSINSSGSDELPGLYLEKSSDTKIRKIPTLDSDNSNSPSVMEIGKYIDFHEVNSTNDYDLRLQCKNGMLYMDSPSIGEDVVTRSSNIKWWGFSSSEHMTTISTTDGTYAKIPMTTNVNNFIMHSTYLEVRSVGYVNRGVSTWDSDIRFKTNIKENTQKASNIINKIPIKSFYHKMINKDIKWGVVAQDLLDIDKEFVIEIDQEEDKYYNPNHTTLIPLLIKNIQELNQRVTELENIIKKGDKNE